MWKSLVLFASLGLAGCVAPPAVTYVSLALDGASFVATGKSVSDHALSLAVAKDCAVWRAVTEQDVDAVCRDVAGDGETGGAVMLGVVSVIETLFLEVDPAKVVREDRAPTPAAAGENLQAAYLAIGSTRAIDRAERLAGQVPDVAAAVAGAVAGGERYTLIVAGPYSKDQ